MRRLRLGAVALVVAAAMTAAFASTALAFPSQPQPCSSCHSGVNVPVTATLASTAGTTATYNASAPGANDIAVFDGTTKVASISAASGQFSVATGKTYTVYSVKGPSTADGIGSTSVSPVAPVLDLIAPTTLSNAVASYPAAATIQLTAADNIGGSGVASTYYVVDGGAQLSGLTVNVAGTGAHTLEFWSVDVAGNIEARKFANFDVTASTAVASSIALGSKSATLATYGSTFSVLGTLTANGAGLPGQRVILQTSTNGIAFADSSTFATTTATGTFALRAVPTRKMWYRVRLAESASYLGSTSSVVFALPRALVLNPVAPAIMYRARAAAVYGYVKPRFTAGTYPVRIYLYRYVSGAWKAYGFVNAKASNYSTYTKYTASVKFAYAGKWRVRAYHPAEALHAASWSAAYDVVTVK